MIAALEGILEAHGPDWAVVRVGGVSLRVQVPASALESLGPPGGKVKLYTHLQVREDNLSLYGFPSAPERDFFELLQTVGGVGPRVALSLLSAMPPERLAGAIAAENIGALSMVPGVGKKIAGRLVLELKGKIERLGLAAVAAPEGEAEVLAVLTGLGYSLAEAASALAAQPREPGLTLEEKVRRALQQLGGR